MKRIPFRDGDEVDAFWSPRGRQMYHWPPGALARLKRRYHKRERRAGRCLIRQMDEA